MSTKLLQKYGCSHICLKKTLWMSCRNGAKIFYLSQKYCVGFFFRMQTHSCCRFYETCSEPCVHKSRELLHLSKHMNSNRTLCFSQVFSKQRSSWILKVRTEQILLIPGSIARSLWYAWYTCLVKKPKDGCGGEMLLSEENLKREARI